MDNIIDFCRLFYASHYLPIAGYVDGRQVICCLSMENDPGIFRAAEETLLTAEKNPAVFSMEAAGVYGTVKIEATGGRIIIGPLFNGEVSDEAVYAFMRSNTIAVSNKNGVMEFLKSLPGYTYNRFLNMLAFLHMSLNGKSIDVTEHFSLSDTSAGARIAVQHTLSTVKAKELQSGHGTYLFEMRMLEYVKSGDVHSLDALLQSIVNTQAMQEGILAESPLRQAKNLLIGLATMVGKVGAIEGGMDIEEAYNLIDLYIQECERAQSIEPIKTLQYNLLFDFAERVSRSKLPKGVSKEVFSCAEFIKNHTCDHITIDDVAAHIGKSRAYTTRKFKAELGTTIGSYITECKISEAKNLLRHSDFTVSQISDYLFFANQPYFQNVFKRETGMTPTEYRST